MKKSTICLDIIVRNEAPVIERMLDTVIDVIDYYIIVDTGSEDNTVEVIKNYFKDKDIDGELHEREWVNFGHNRTEALNLALGKADYILTIDADEELIIENKEVFHSLTKDQYLIKITMNNNGFSWDRPGLLRITEDIWEWKGAVHNYVSCKSGSCEHGGTLEGVKIISHVENTGKSYNVTSKQKYLNDAKLLADELERNPSSTRSQFYLAQSYRDAGEVDLAIEHYAKRVEMGGWPEEVYMSQLYKGNLMINAGDKYTEEEIFGALTKAWCLRPHRAESLFHLTRFARMSGHPLQADLFAKVGVKLPIPEKDILFVQEDIYKWRLYDEYSIICYKLNNKDDCLISIYNVFTHMQENPKSIPSREKERLLMNANYSVRKFLETGEELNKSENEILSILREYFIKKAM